MAENRIELKSIEELLGMKFFIPSYQRGYRWTEQQVKDLLNDINEFKQSLDSDDTISKDDFYCLQPLVVKECINDKEGFLKQLPKEGYNNSDVLEKTRKAISDNTKWEVIDGQQRLTTIFILLSFLNGLLNNDEIGLYSIDYQTRGPFDDFLKQLMIDLGPNNLELSVASHQIRFINEQFEALLKKKRPWDNIDFYHIIQTFVTIKNWFEAKDRCYQESFRDILLKRVKFIWYESVDEDPIKVFTRLNIGKIKLTNAELIKALFLNRSNFKTDSNDHLKLRQQEIASEWDYIENTLQNDEFWLFLHNIGYDRPTRIDFIFDMICEHNSLKLNKESISHIGSDDYKTFRYFYEYFRLEKHDIRLEKHDTKIKVCWSKVKDYFQTFQEWFNDLELYHYIGVLLSDYFTQRGRGLSAIFSKWSGTKTDFVCFLKEEIRKTITIPKEKYFCDENHIEASLHFEKDKNLIRQILLMHNVQTIVIQNSQFSKNEKYKIPVFYKFPFHLFKREKWDVEHIDSNTSNDLSDIKQQTEWLLAAWIVVSESLQKKIQEFINNESSDSFEDLKSSIDSEIGHKKNKLNESERMRIWNLALLDETTNKGYHNDIFPLKRQCIIGKDQGVILDSVLKKENGNFRIELTKKAAEISFIPVCTKNVFLKYYTPTTNNLMDWDKHDAKAYKENIIESLKEFGIIDSSSNKSKNEDNNEQK